MQEEQLAAPRREQLLIDMVLHQDVEVAEMQQQQAAEVAMAQPHWTNSSSNRDAPTPASSPSPLTSADAAGRAAAAAQAGTRRAAGSFSSQAADGSYVMRLLHNATVEQVQLVEAWGVEDWCSYWRSLFARVVVLLELATGEAADASTPQQTTAALCAASNHQLLHSAHPAAAQATASASAASSTAAAAAAAARGVYMQRLEQIMEEVQTLVYLAHCHNHIPMYQSVVVNLETGEQGTAATEGRRLHVAQRMELTPWQVQQLAAALAEFERLSHHHSREGTALLSRANSPGWMFAEAAQQAGMGLQGDGGGSRDTAEPPPAAAAAAAAAYASPGATASADEASLCRSSSSGSNGSDSTAVDAGGSCLDQQLRRHVKSRHLHMISLHMVIANTLSHLQAAKCLVASYPFGPMPTAVTEAVALAAAESAPGTSPSVMLDGSTAGARPNCSTATCPALQLYQQQHEAARAALLSRQQQRWWQEMGGH
ncbi:hypothetical protein OEZ86_001034 [Tetradesmus obliquus]|nr:hypothetical protein OEZ86_001034 [Tetradesmus obliquus]